MRENEINDLITDALHDAPPAPEALRHNVMSAVYELDYVPKRSKRTIFKAASALACVVVIAVVVIVARPMLSNNKTFNAVFDSANSSMSSGFGGADAENAALGDGANENGAPQMAAADTSTFDGTGAFSINEAESSLEETVVEADDAGIRYDMGFSPAGAGVIDGAKIKIEDTMDSPNDQASIGTTYIVTGELPEELAELGYTVFAENYRIYENVPDEIIALLLANNAFITEAPVDGTGNVVKWTP